MPTLNEVIRRLQTVRKMMKTGDVDFAICVAGKDGFTTRDLNITEPATLKVTGKRCAFMVCRKEAPLGLSYDHIPLGGIPLEMQTPGIHKDPDARRLGITPRPKKNKKPCAQERP